MGYMNGEVDLTTRAKGKHLTAVYTLHPGTPFFINSVRYDIQDSIIAKMLDLDNPNRQELKAGDPFTVTRLEDDPSLLEGRLLILDEAQKILLTLENLSRKSYLLTDLVEQLDQALSREEG